MSTPPPISDPLESELASRGVRGGDVPRLAALVRAFVRRFPSGSARASVDVLARELGVSRDAAWRLERRLVALGLATVSGGVGGKGIDRAPSTFTLSESTVAASRAPATVTRDETATAPATSTSVSPSVVSLSPKISSCSCNNNHNTGSVVVGGGAAACLGTRDRDGEPRRSRDGEPATAEFEKLALLKARLEVRCLKAKAERLESELRDARAAAWARERDPAATESGTDPAPIRHDPGAPTGVEAHPRFADVLERVVEADRRSGKIRGKGPGALGAYRLGIVANWRRDASGFDEALAAIQSKESEGARAAQALREAREKNDAFLARHPVVIPPRPRDSDSAVLAALESGPKATAELVRATGLGETVVKTARRRLESQGAIERLGGTQQETRYRVAQRAATPVESAT